MTARDATLLHDVESLVDPMMRGDPPSPLRCTCKSTRRLATELQALAGNSLRRCAKVLTLLPRSFDS